MRTGARVGQRGMTLVELMIVVAIVGVLSTLAIYVGVARYMSSAKTAEAKHIIGTIARNAVAAFERETAVSEILPEGNKATVMSHALCDSAKPVPGSLDLIKGRQYQPTSEQGKDFETGDPKTGWKCLQFAVHDPVYYQYSYTKGASVVVKGAAAVAGNGFEAAAQGDIDGDGDPGQFAVTGDVNPATGSIRIASHIYINNEFE